jgi:hypothetical protein
MKKGIALFFLAFIVMITMGCAFTIPLAVTSNPIGRKMGTSEISLLFNVIPLKNDAGVLAAARNGGIVTISTVDIKRSWWVIGTTITTIVSGD